MPNIAPVKGKTRSWHSYAILILVSLLVSGTLVEGLVRVFFPHTRDHVLPQGLAEMDRQLGWRFRPNSSGRHRTRYFDVAYQINSLGFRDKERSPKKPPGVYRALLLGDSQVFGWGVPATGRFSELLEKQVAGLELCNLGIPGYGLDQEILLYERAAAALEADRAIFLVSRFTGPRDYTHYIFNKYKPQFELDAAGGVRQSFAPGGRASVEDVLYRSLGTLYLPSFIDISLQGLRREVPTPRPQCDRCFGELERRLLVRAAASAAARKQTMSVILDLPDTVRAGVETFCREKRFRCMSLAIDDTAQELRMSGDDPHWTPLANRLAAQQLLPYFEPAPADLGTLPGR
jgi:hypothetical protein